MESVRFHDNYIFAETIKFDSNSPAIRHFKKPHNTGRTKKQNTSWIGVQNFRFVVFFSVLGRIPRLAANNITFMSIFIWITHRLNAKILSHPGNFKDNGGQFPVKSELNVQETLKSFEIRGQNEKPSDFFANAFLRMLQQQSTELFRLTKHRGL